MSFETREVKSNITKMTTEMDLSSIYGLYFQVSTQTPLWFVHLTCVCVHSGAQGCKKEKKTTCSSKRTLATHECVVTETDWRQIEQNNVSYCLLWCYKEITDYYQHTVNLIKLAGKPGIINNLRPVTNTACGDLSSKQMFTPHYQMISYRLIIISLPSQFVIGRWIS